MELSKERRDLIRKMIQGQQSRYIEKLSNTRTVHQVVIDGVPMRVIWDKRHDLIVTVLPLNEQESI